VKDAKTIGAALAPVRRRGAKHRILEHLQKHVGQMVRTKDLQAVAGISDYQRRIRELRDEGWQIESDKDREGLKPGEYVLVSAAPRMKREHGIPASVRREVLIRDGSTCQMCGAGVGDPHPSKPGRRVRLQVDHIDPDGASTPDNLRTLCSACHEGRENVETPPPEVMHALRIVRRAPERIQKQVLDFLLKKFERVVPDDRPK